MVRVDVVTNRGMETNLILPFGEIF